MIKLLISGNWIFWILFVMPIVLVLSLAINVARELSDLLKKRKVLFISYLAIFLLSASLVLLIDLKFSSLIFIVIVFILPEVISLRFRNKWFSTYPTSFLFIAIFSLLYSLIAAFLVGP